MTKPREQQDFKAAENYADSCSPNDKRPSIGSTHSLEIGMRSLWESDREAFLAGCRHKEAQLASELAQAKARVSGLSDELEDTKEANHNLQSNYDALKAELAAKDAEIARLREAQREASEHIQNARSEASSVLITKDYIIDECCMALAKLADKAGEGD